MKVNIPSILFVCLLLCSCGKNEVEKIDSENIKNGNRIDAVETIASNAFIYGYPMFELYGIIYAYNIDNKNPEYKAQFNKIANIPRVFTSDDIAIVTPNSDTPYSFLTMDLRSEPIVITVPKIGNDRYYSVMLLDLYTYIYDVIGSRTSGNEEGKFLIAGPDWKGETPAGIKKVIKCETQFSLAFFRTQLFNPEDLKNVIEIQNQYGAEPLSSYLKTEPPPDPPKIDFPVYNPSLIKGPEFYSILNFLLQFCPVNPSEKELRTSFEKIGILPGKPYAPAGKDSMAISEGKIDAVRLMTNSIQKDIKEGVSSGEFFGSREFLGNNFLKRASGAKLGIGGLTKEEAIYFIYKTDEEGKQYNTAMKNYEITFKPGQLPPVKAFWSLTMYDGNTQTLIENQLDRYTINSPMLPKMKYNDDSSLTIYIQKDYPGADKESNWLPAPNDYAYIVLRTYWPKEAILNGAWKHPDLITSN